jgi:cytochrome P450
LEVVAMAESKDTPEVAIAFRRTGPADPAKPLDELREQCPIARFTEGGRFGSYWAILRYEDIAAAARQSDLFINQGHNRLRRRRLPLESDPPEHTQIRRLLQPFFFPTRLQAFEPLSRQIAIECLAPLIENGGGDAAAALAKPLPPQVLLSLIGQPREDWHDIKRWCENVYLDRSSDPADRALFAQADEALWHYSEQAVAERKRAPRAVNEDFISSMLAATIDGKQVDDETIVGVVRLFIAAGHDSTTSSVGICVKHLADNAGDQRRLRQKPEMIPTAIEEILRVKSPVLGMPRTVARDVEFAGQQLKAGDPVRLMWASGNRDPRALADADRCIIDRPIGRSLTFGMGIHMCIGAPLARQEIKVALEELLARTAEFGLAGEPVMQFWHPHGPHSLPIWVKT